MIDDNPVVRSVARAIDGAISRAIQGANATVWDPAAEIDRFREVREKTLAILANLTTAQASWSPRNGAWSIAQIVDHLLLTEQMYREQFERVIQMSSEGKGSSIEISLDEVDVGFAAIPRGVVSLFEVPMRMFNLFVPHVVRETMVRYSIVSSLNPRKSQPREGLVLGKLRQDLVSSLGETEDLVLERMPRNADELAINHPIMGNNTIPQLFRIVIAHEQRHQEQMERLRADSGFPRVSQEPMNAAQMADLFGVRGN